MTSCHAVETSFIIKTAVFLQGFPAKRKVLRNIRISSEFWETFGNVCVAYGQLLENLRKSSESGLKSSKNRQVEHSKRNSISTRVHVFMSMYLSTTVLFRSTITLEELNKRCN